MLRMLFIGVLLISVLAACGGRAPSMPGPDDSPVSLSTDKPIPFTATPETPSTAVPRSEQPQDVEYSSVAEALADLKTRAGVSIEVLQGWTIVAEADGSTTWSFAPPDHPAFPAVAKRVLYRDQDGWQLKMDVLCEAEAAACDQFVRYFEALNRPIYQMIEQQQEP
jgi:hypothetical protein